MVVILGLLAGPIGCVNVRNQASQESVLPCPPNEVPPLQRQRTYLFMMNGPGWYETIALHEFRNKLAAVGYPKVYIAKRSDRAWYYREMHRLRRDEPESRVVLLAYGLGAEPITALAFDAARDGLPVEMVMFVNPIGVSGNLADTLPFHTVLVRSAGWPGGRNLTTRDSVDLPYHGHLSLTQRAVALEAIVTRLAAVASQVQLPGLDSLPRLELRDKPAPTPQPVDPTTLANWPAGADFLSAPQPFPTLPWDGTCPRLDEPLYDKWCPR